MVRMIETPQAPQESNDALVRRLCRQALTPDQLLEIEADTRMELPPLLDSRARELYLDGDAISAVTAHGNARSIYDLAGHTHNALFHWMLRLKNARPCPDLWPIDNWVHCILDILNNNRHLISYWISPLLLELGSLASDHKPTRLGLALFRRAVATARDDELRHAILQRYVWLRCRLKPSARNQSRASETYDNNAAYYFEVGNHNRLAIVKCWTLYSFIEFGWHDRADEQWTAHRPLIQAHAPAVAILDVRSAMITSLQQRGDHLAANRFAAEVGDTYREAHVSPINYPMPDGTDLFRSRTLEEMLNDRGVRMFGRRTHPPVSEENLRSALSLSFEKSGPTAVSMCDTKVRAYGDQIINGMRVTLMRLDEIASARELFQHRWPGQVVDELTAPPVHASAEGGGSKSAVRSWHDVSNDRIAILYQVLRHVVDAMAGPYVHMDIATFGPQDDGEDEDVWMKRASQRMYDFRRYAAIQWGMNTSFIKQRVGTKIRICLDECSLLWIRTTVSRNKSTLNRSTQSC